jgi:hypothetical protein
MPPKRKSQRSTTAAAAATTQTETQQSNKHGKDESTVTERPKKRVKKTYYIVILKNGSWKTFDSAGEMTAFKDDWGESVKASMDFSSKKKMQAKVKELEAAKLSEEAKTKDVTVKVEKGSDDVKSLTTDQQASAEKIIQAIRKNSPSDRIHVYYRTNSSSKAVVFVPLQVDANGNLKWWFKGKQWATVVKYYAGTVTHEHESIQHALKHMEFAYKRDPSGGPEDKQVDKSKRKVEEKGKTKYVETGNTYPVTIPYTHMIIPTENFSNTVQETEWIEKTLETFAKETIKLHQSELFKTVIKGSVSDRQRNSMMFNSKQQTYSQCYSTCSTRVERLDNINSLIALEDVTKVMSILSDNATDDFKNKYPSLDIVDENEEDTDEEDSDDDNEDEDEEEDQKPAAVETVETENGKDE